MVARTLIYLDIAGPEVAMGAAMLTMDRAEAAMVRENILSGCKRVDLVSRVSNSGRKAVTTRDEEMRVVCG